MHVRHVRVHFVLHSKIVSLDAPKRVVASLALIVSSSGRIPQQRAVFCGRRVDRQRERVGDNGTEDKSAKGKGVDLAVVEVVVLLSLVVVVSCR